MAAKTFAYQGFGFGEFFKAQQQLSSIRSACFLGVFDAPSSFLSLGRSLESLADRIERLFDENGNPNSALLRAENKPPAQQMLRIASHGLLESLRQLETVIPIQQAKQDPLDLRGYNIVMHLRLAGEDKVLDILVEKFEFMIWKLDLFFKVLRKSKISQTLSVYDGVQKRIGSFFEELAARKSTASYNTMSSNAASESSAIAEVDVIQRFQDACEFGGGSHRFVWKLQPESTILITLHWVYILNRQNNPKITPIETYVNLMKCSWLLRVSTPEAGVEGFSDEVRTMIGLLGCDVVYRLQSYFEADVETPLPSELADHGDFNIFIEGVNKRDLGAGLTRTAVPHAFPGYEPQSEPAESSEYGMRDHMRESFDSDRRSQVDKISQIEGVEGVVEGVKGGSMDIDVRRRSDYSAISNTSAGSGFRSMPGTPYIGRPGILGDGGTSHSQSPSISSMGAVLGSVHSRGSSSGVAGYSPDFFPSQRIALTHSRPSTSGTSGPPAIPKKLKSHNYSWNERIDQEQLGLRPGEVEILPAEFGIMRLMASYTGDKEGRWDDCRIRIFQTKSDKTLRILTLMEGTQESIDQRVAYVKEAELVPDYGYKVNRPVIYIRKTHRQDPFLNGNTRKIANGKPMPPSSLYYKFFNAHDMFNFQLALLGETVETDFAAVRTVRLKKSSLRDVEHSHYGARIQIWREQSSLDPVLSSEPSVAPASTREAWAQPSLKIHNTRVVMYWSSCTTTFFITDSIEIETNPRRFSIKIKPSTYKTFQNPTSVKARTFGSHDSPGGFRLDKKGLFADDEEGFEDFKWVVIEFNNLEEMTSFQEEVKRALNLRRKERWEMEELKRLAARGVQAGAEVGVKTR